MKKILVLILLAFVSIQTYSQTAVFTFSGDLITSCEIKSDKDSVLATSENGVLDYRGLISKIKFIENPNLDKEADHYFKINDDYINFVDKKNKSALRGKSDNEGSIKDCIKLQPGNYFTLFRDTIINNEKVKKEIGKIAIKIAKTDSIEEKIKFTPIDSLELGSLPKTYRFKVENKSGCFIDNLEFKYSDTTINVVPYNENIISLKLDPEKLKNVSDSLSISITYKIRNHDYYKVNPIKIATVKLKKQKNNDNESSWWEKAVKILIVVLLVSIAIYKRKRIKRFVVNFVRNRFLFKRSKSSLDIPLRDNSILKCYSASNAPSKGDEVDREGVFVASDGVVYQCEKNNKKRIVITAVLTRIPCKGDQYIDVEDTLEELPATSYYIVQNINGKDVKIYKGISAFSEYAEKIFVTENNYVVCISNNKIKSICYRIDLKSEEDYIDVEINDSVPQEGDVVVKSTVSKKRLIAKDGKIYEIANKKIAKIIPSGASPMNNDETDTHFSGGSRPFPLDNTVAKLKEELIKAQQTNLKLEEQLKGVYTKEEYEQLKQEKDNLERKLREVPSKEEYEILKEKIKKADRLIQEAKNDGIAVGKYETEKRYKKLILEKYISLDAHDELVKHLKEKKEEAVNAKERADETIKKMEGQIRESASAIHSLKGEIQAKGEVIINLTATNEKLKDAAKKKNMHYILQIQETLGEISETFKDVYKDINNQQIKEGLISPMIRGVSGLSTGIHSWAEDFTVKVLEESEGFFGADFLAMQESEVKELLAKKFISNIIKSDSFSKFIRLYQLSTVPFIRKQLIEAQLNVSVLNKLYYKVYSLVTDFGYTIICPRLFEEQYEEAKYQWFNTTNLFSIIELTDDAKNQVKGSDIIIDINQVGFSSKWANRRATAVTPDF